MSSKGSIYKFLIVKLHKAQYRRSKTYRPKNPCFMCKQPVKPLCYKTCIHRVSKWNMEPYEVTHIHSYNSESLKNEK